MNATPSSNKRYFLQDSRGNVGDNLMFWAKQGSYTSDVSNAQTYSEDQAFSQNRCRPTDIPWPTDYVVARTRPVVDMQYVKQAAALAYAESEHFYLQARPRDYIGNDIVFIAQNGKGRTANLNDAKVFSKTELFDGNEQVVPGVAWPKAYLDARSRPAADYRLVKLEEALQDGMTALAKPEKPKKERYRCEGCGIFLAIGDYYGLSGCKRCGCDNRP